MEAEVQRPPWARVYAINASTGDVAWKVTLGINERLPKEKQNVGSIGGAGSTVTAGGLLFVPTNDTWFHALDSKTGAVLWRSLVDAPTVSMPAVYTYKGREYVTFAVGGNSILSPKVSDQLIAFALPQ